MLYNISLLLILYTVAWGKVESDTWDLKNVSLQLSTDEKIPSDECNRKYSHEITQKQVKINNIPVDIKRSLISKTHLPLLSVPFTHRQKSIKLGIRTYPAKMRKEHNWRVSSILQSWIKKFCRTIRIYQEYVHILKLEEYPTYEHVEILFQAWYLYANSNTLYPSSQTFCYLSTVFLFTLAWASSSKR